MDGIVFDMDGVLLDTERRFQECWTEAAAEYGLDKAVADSLVLECIGLDTRVTESLCRERLAEMVSYEQLMKRVREIFKRKRIEEGLPVKAGAYMLLEYLRTNRIPAGLASSTSYGTIVEELKELKMLDYFKVIVGGDMVKAGKPSPDVYEKACRGMNLACDRAIAIEDSKNGLMAAKRAGLKTIMVPDLLPYTEELEPWADEHFNTLNDVLLALQKGEILL